MASKSGIEKVRRRAAELFKSGIAGSSLVQDIGKVEAPIPILGPENTVVSWFVGVTARSRIAGFMQFNPDLTLTRYSTFQRDPSSLESCPAKEMWLDPCYILERAKTKASADDRLSAPFMTYDSNPSRIVWSVEARSKENRTKRIFVAGDFVYLPRAG